MILNKLQKTFGTIDHVTLLQKLYAISFSKHSVNSFQSYVNNRLFLVKLEKNLLMGAMVYHKVFRLLSILVYINDMPESVRCSIFLYANDFCLVTQNKDVN